MRKKISLIFALFVALLWIIPANTADMGMIGPPLIDIEENAQNAIVAWNGTEEVLILSTDATSSQSSLVLRVIPLPSDPLEIKEGSFDSFIRLQEIVNEKLKRHYLDSGYGLNEALGKANESGIEIIYQNVIGAHNITVVKVNNTTFFVEWVEIFTMESGLVNITFSDSFKSSVEDYIDRDIRYFVFDLIETNETQQSINPIVYRFATNFLYYPLNITAFSDVGETYSQVNVFLLSKGLIKEDALSWYRYYFSFYINLTKDELKDISLDIYKLFEGDPFLATFNYNGRLSYLQEDIIASAQDFAYPNVELEFEDVILIEQGKLKAAEIKVKNIGDEGLYVRLDIKGGITELKHKWFSVEPWGAHVGSGNETVFEVLYTIPSNIPAGKYDIRYVVTSYEYGEYIDVGEGFATLVVQRSVDNIEYLWLGIIANAILIIIVFIVLAYLILRKGS